MAACVFVQVVRGVSLIVALEELLEQDKEVLAIVRVFAVQVVLSQLYVAFSDRLGGSYFFGRYVANGFCRYAGHHGSVGYDGTGSDHSAGCDQAVLADNRVIEDGCPDSDHGAITNF